MINLPEIILGLAIHDRPFLATIYPYVRPELFESKWQSRLFETIKLFYHKFQTNPTIEALQIELPQNLSSEEKEQINLFFNRMTRRPNVQFEWALESTEKWTRERSIYLALMKSVEILNDRPEKQGQIPDLLQKAIGVSFDNRVGHDYIDESLERFRSYTSKKKVIPFDLEQLNQAIGGGVSGGTITIVLASTGVGKSMFMCHTAASMLSQGYNVLYLTLELSEYIVGKRIDANLLDCPMNRLVELHEEEFKHKFYHSLRKTHGKLIVRQYPTSAASVIQFRALLDELKTKRDFIPDVIFVDYLNICASSRNNDRSTGLYLPIKQVAEELRGLAIDFNVPLITAAQTNRAGFRNSDVEISEVGESWGIPQTADFMFALISLPDLKARGELLIKILKVRDGEGEGRSFPVSIDYSRVKFCEIEPDSASTQTNKHYLHLMEALAGD